MVSRILNDLEWQSVGPVFYELLHQLTKLPKGTTMSQEDQFSQVRNVMSRLQMTDNIENVPDVCIIWEVSKAILL